MSDPHRLCFLNGEMLPLADAKVSVLDRSFLFGDGVYEVIPVYDGQPFVLDSHLQDFPAPSEKAMESGLSATICADFRWGRCDIKATSLLANVLLRQQAADQDADEAILERDGMITEGASSSVFALIDGTLRTPEDAPTLLPGTTRDRVIDVARDQGIVRRVVDPFFNGTLNWDNNT